MKKYDLILVTAGVGCILTGVGTNNGVRSVDGMEVKREVIKSVPSVEIWDFGTIIVFLR